jgi:hypothetical protein
MSLINEPNFEPSVVCASSIVGLVEVLQHTPLTVTGVPPSEIIFPPDFAVVAVIKEIEDVITVGIPHVVNEISAP